MTSSDRFTDSQKRIQTYTNKAKLRVNRRSSLKSDPLPQIRKHCSMRNSRIVPYDTKPSHRFSHTCCFFHYARFAPKITYTHRSFFYTKNRNYPQLLFFITKISAKTSFVLFQQFSFHNTASSALPALPPLFCAASASLR